MQEFEPIEAMQGIVATLKEIVGDDVGEAVYQDSDGEWQTLSGTPAIYIGYQDIPTPNYPLIYLIYNGQTSLGSGRFDGGLTEDPDASSSESSSENLIPYTQRYVKYSVTLWAQGGPQTDVLTGTYKSSAYLLGKINTSLTIEAYADMLQDNTNSTFDIQESITPGPFIKDNVYVDASSITMPFDVINTAYDRTGTGWFNTVVVTGTGYNSDGSSTPVTSRITSSSEDL